MVALACTLFTVARPAAADVVEVMTSIPAAEAEDETKLDMAVPTAVDQVATHAVAFAPTVVSLRDAKIVGDRIYLFVLLADAAGEAERAALKNERTQSGAYSRRKTPECATHAGRSLRCDDHRAARTGPSGTSNESTATS